MCSYRSYLSGQHLSAVRCGLVMMKRIHTHTHTHYYSHTHTHTCSCTSTHTKQMVGFVPILTSAMCQCLVGYCLAGFCPMGFYAFMPHPPPPPPWLCFLCRCFSAICLIFSCTLFRSACSCCFKQAWSCTDSTQVLTSLHRCKAC